jgi:hypothetical protein
MSWRRKPKPVPVIRVKVDGMVLRDPARDEREAQVLVRAWAAAWAALVPVLPRRGA